MVAFFRKWRSNLRGRTKCGCHLHLGHSQNLFMQLTLLVNQSLGTGMQKDLVHLNWLSTHNIQCLTIRPFSNFLTVRLILDVSRDGLITLSLRTSWLAEYKVQKEVFMLFRKQHPQYLFYMFSCQVQLDLGNTRAANIQFYISAFRTVTCLNSILFILELLTSNFNQ